MPGHDLIVIGGSAGSVEALSALLAGLPPDLPAAVCIVMHQSAYLPNRRAEIFGRASTLPVMNAEQGMRIKPGVVYLAMPDMHLLIEHAVLGTRDTVGVLRLVRGPKENRVRPAVDPLFRTAALTYGSRTIGVVLSGALDDGTAGLWVIKDRGGITVAQDPADATVGSMPANAISEVVVDHVLPAAELGPLLGRLARQQTSLPVPEGPIAAPRADDRLPEPPRSSGGSDLEREIAITKIDEDAHQASERYGVPSRFACPDCGGNLWNTKGNAGPLRFRCETGHAHSPATLADGQAEAVEYGLWAALRALEDKAELARVRGGLARERGLESHALQFDLQVQSALAQGGAIRDLLRG